MVAHASLAWVDRMTVFETQSIDCVGGQSNRVKGMNQFVAFFCRVSQSLIWHLSASRFLRQ
jgi:hypothetical protein